MDYDDIYATPYFWFKGRSLPEPVKTRRPSLRYLRMQDLRLTLVQTPIRWEDPEGARKDLDGHLDAISGPTDLIVLSEMFTTGFSMDSHRLAEDMDGPSVRWMLWQAERLQALVL